MATLTRGELTAQELLSHEMGLHTEKLGGRSQQIFFDFDLNEAQNGFSLPNAYDVDYNKRAEIDASNMPPNTVNLRIRELMQDGYGTIVIRNPGAKHSIAVGILNRLTLHEPIAGLTRAYPLVFEPCQAALVEGHAPHRGGALAHDAVVAPHQPREDRYRDRQPPEAQTRAPTEDCQDTAATKVARRA